MSINAKPKMLFNNIFTLGVPTATDTDSNSQYDVLNIADWRYYTLWKAASFGTKYLTIDTVINENGGFETGDWTGWTQGLADMEAVVTHGGSDNSAKLETGGGANAGPTTVDIEVDATKTYQIKAFLKVTARGAPSVFSLFLNYFNEDDVLIDTETIGSMSAVTDWTLSEKTMGPTGSGADFIFPAGTKEINVYLFWSGGGTGTGYLDDFFIYPINTVNALTIANHNFFSANADVSVEYSNDVVETDDLSWTEGLAAFNTDNNKVFLKTLTEQTVRAWRIKIVTASIVPYCGMVWLGDIFTFEKYPIGAFDPQPETLKSELTKSMSGYPLGTIIDYYERDIPVNFRRLTPSWVANTFSDAWAHLRQGLPVVWAADITNHPTEIYIGSIPPKFALKMPYDPVTRSLGLTFNTIVES